MTATSIIFIIVLVALPVFISAGLAYASYRYVQHRRIHMRDAQRARNLEHTRRNQQTGIELQDIQMPNKTYFSSNRYGPRKSSAFPNRHFEEVDVERPRKLVISAPLPLNDHEHHGSVNENSLGLHGSPVLEPRGSKHLEVPRFFDRAARISADRDMSRSKRENEGFPFVSSPGQTRPIVATVIEKDDSHDRHKSAALSDIYGDYYDTDFDSRCSRIETALKELPELPPPSAFSHEPEESEKDTIQDRNSIKSQHSWDNEWTRQVTEAENKYMGERIAQTLSRTASPPQHTLPEPPINQDKLTTVAENNTHGDDDSATYTAISRLNPFMQGHDILRIDKTSRSNTFSAYETERERDGVRRRGSDREEDRREVEEYLSRQELGRALKGDILRRVSLGNARILREASGGVSEG